MVEHKLIAASLIAFKKVMEKNKIPFWLEYGTQLGAVREGKIIEWDLDGDVGVWLKDIQRMKDVEEDFKVAGIQLFYQPTHVYINLKMPDGTWRMTVDVYTFIRVNNENGSWLIRIENGEEEDVRSPYVYYRMLKEIGFLGTKFPIPIDAEKALEFAYGKEWRIPIQMGKAHHLKLKDL